MLTTNALHTICNQPSNAKAGSAGFVVSHISVDFEVQVKIIVRQCAGIWLGVLPLFFDIAIVAVDHSDCLWTVAMLRFTLWGAATSVTTGNIAKRHRSNTKQKGSVRRHDLDMQKNVG